MDAVAARLEMVDRQIAARGITDAAVLAVMREVPRHLFVARADRDRAYEDRPLSIGQGQTISQPYMVAAMTAALDVRPSDRVLEIGTGSGYQTAVVARLAGHVFSVERRPALATAALGILHELGIKNVQVRVADGTEGWPDHAPFDRILVTAGAPRVPAPLRSQLSDRGRLVIPVGPPGQQRLTVLAREGARFEIVELDACVFVPLVGRHGWSTP